MPENLTAPPTLNGLIPTGWYPGFIAIDKKQNHILVPNVRSIGLEGPNNHDLTKRPLVCFSATFSGLWENHRELPKEVTKA